MSGMLLFIVGLLGAPVTDGPASMRTFGAVGDGTADDSAAFRAAFASGGRDIYLPPGTYLVGPDPLELAGNTRLHGAGDASLLKVAEGTEKLLVLGAGVRLERFAIDGGGAKSGGVDAGLVALPDAADGAALTALTFRDCDRACIYTDHADDVLVRDCTFRKVGVAVSIVFSKRVRVIANQVFDARVHGIQFWGNWQWEAKECADLLFAHNHVRNGGGGAIWGTGARRVVMTGNIVDGASDVGLDLEWCDDSVITGNTVRNCVNAGIALFFGCRNVTISGNTILNDHPISEEEAGKDWWVRSGIWLTPPNRETYKQDHGHRNVTIVANTIDCADGARRDMWIGSEARNVVISDNAVAGRGILYGGHHAVHPQRLAEVAQPVRLHDRPTPDEPKF